MQRAYIQVCGKTASSNTEAKESENCLNCMIFWLSGEFMVLEQFRYGFWVKALIFIDFVRF
jgi:hypothetical protein